VLLSIVFIYCVSLLLAGNGSIVPEGGSVIGGKCQSNGSLPAETVSLSLRINEAYRLDVFIAERFRCKSHILFQSSGVSFLLDDARPADYFAVISEDAHVGSLVQVFNVSDTFSSGPYDVDILEENEQDRFEIEDGTYMAPNAPVTPAPPSFILDGETIILCPNATDDPLDPIPNINSGIQSFTSITTSTASLTLKALLDFESTPSYELYLRITDTNKGWIGNITIKVNKF